MASFGARETWNSSLTPTFLSSVSNPSADFFFYYLLTHSIGPTAGHHLSIAISGGSFLNSPLTTPAAVRAFQGTSLTS